MTHAPVAIAAPASFPSAISQLAARVAIGAAALTLILLAALHLLRADLDPSWHMLSEYAVGPHAGVMSACFAAFAASSAALFVALIAHVRTVVGRIGVAFLLAAAVGLTMAALFPMDPLGTPPEAASFSARMHGVSTMIGGPGELFAVLLLSLALRKQAAWARLPLLTVAGLIWLSLVIMVALLMIAMQQPSMSEGFFGWPNRTVMIAYSVWLMLAAWPIARPTPVR